MCLFEGGGWGAGLGVFFSRVGLRMADLNFNHRPRGLTRGGRLLPNLVPMFNKNEEKGYFSQSCLVRSAIIV